MKTVLLFTLLLSSSWLLAQPNFNTVINALKSGNVSSIGSSMEEQVELAVASQNGTYPKAQAISMVNSFLQTNKPSSCSLVHSGSARDGASYYCIGSLNAGGKKYRVYIFFKKNASDYKVQEIRIEPE
jgi:hypothetical protein